MPNFTAHRVPGANKLTHSEQRINWIKVFYIFSLTFKWLSVAHRHIFGISSIKKKRKREGKAALLFVYWLYFFFLLRGVSMLTANNFLISHAPLNFARIFNSSLEKKWRQMMFRYDSIVSHRSFCFMPLYI